MSNEPPSATIKRFYDNYYFKFLTGPGKYIRENYIDPLREKNKGVYYHRQYRRVPSIDECAIGDQCCMYEANEQFKRDKNVESEIVRILRERMLKCVNYYGIDNRNMCGKEVDEVQEAEAAWFQKYGDLGFYGTVLDCYMKQKHRMIWERRHGPVGSGLKKKPEIEEE